MNKSLESLDRLYRAEERLADTVLDPNTPSRLAARLARGKPWLQKPAKSVREIRASKVEHAAHSKSLEE